MAAGTFYFTNPEAARQAIAEMQVSASAAENASRERIAKEQTASQRYATQSQISENEKDRAVNREDIASRSGVSADAVSRERANIQYQTILRSINAYDPLTKKELEALMVASPNLTDDLRNSLRSERETAYKAARANAAMGAKRAENYNLELAGKKPGDATLDQVYQRISNDKNIVLDRAAGTVRSAFPMPREDAPSGSQTETRTIDDVKLEMANRRNGVRSLVGALPPAQSSITATPSPGRVTDFSVPAAPAAAPAPSVNAFGVPTFGGMLKSIPISPYGGLAWPSRTAPVRVADIAPPPPTVNAFGIPTFSAILKSIPISPYGGLAIPSRTAPAAPRMADIAAPPPMEPGWFNVPPELLPPSGSAAPDNRLLQILEKMPQFAALPPAGKQMVLDQVTGGLMSMPEPTPPRVSDFQTLRPEFVPMDDRYVAPQ